MTRLWVRLMKKHRIERQMTVECAFDGAHEALDEACHALDVPRPIWLPKNEREFASFRMTAFTQDHFVEEIHFERMEIEFIDDVRRKSRDPRNDFGF